MTYISLTLLAGLLSVVCCRTILASTTERPDCESTINILINDSVVGQIDSFLRDKVDIIELHIRTDSTFAITDEDGNINNRTVKEASTTEKYNMFIFFIVTETGRSILQYPADAGSLSFGTLNSQKVQIDVDIAIDQYVCPTKSNAFRESCLNGLADIAPVKNDDAISVCYYHIPKYYPSFYASMIFLPYYTYNTFPTFCKEDDGINRLPQVVSNKLLRWVCIGILFTLPIFFYFIPHSVHKNTNTYRRCDIPYSVSMFMSYIIYSKSHHEESKCKGLWPSLTNLKRQFLFMGVISVLLGLCIHFILRQLNPLENNLIILSGSSAFYYIYYPPPSSNARVLLYILVGLSILSITMHTIFKRILNIETEPKTAKVEYPIYILSIQRWCVRCEDINEFHFLCGQPEPLFSMKMISMILFTPTFWRNVLKRSIVLFPLNVCLVFFFILPYTNMFFRTIVRTYRSVTENKPDNRMVRYLWYAWSTFVFLTWRVLVIAAFNLTFMQSVTLILQSLVLTFFVGIPIYPKLIAYVILVSGAMKYCAQVYLQLQKKLKHVLVAMFDQFERLGVEIPNSEISKVVFDIVLRQCPSVNGCVAVLKLVAFGFTFITAYVAINQGEEGVDAWAGVIPAVLVFLGPDWLSRILYNKAADQQFIERCVEVTLTEQLVLLRKMIQSPKVVDCESAKHSEGTEEAHEANENNTTEAADEGIQGEDAAKIHVKIDPISANDNQANQL